MTAPRYCINCRSDYDLAAQWAMCPHGPRTGPGRDSYDDKESFESDRYQRSVDRIRRVMREEGISVAALEEALKSLRNEGPAPEGGQGDT